MSQKAAFFLGVLTRQKMVMVGERPCFSWIQLYSVVHKDRVPITSMGGKFGDKLGQIL